MVQDDGCDYSIKAFNAQNAEAELLLIVTD